MSRLAGRANQSVTLERLLEEDMGEGATYDAPEEILSVYDPVASDLGPDFNERRSGSVLTETEVALGDRIEGQIVTQVIPRFPRTDPVYYEVTL